MQEQAKGQRNVTEPVSTTAKAFLQFAEIPWEILTAVLMLDVIEEIRSLNRQEVQYLNIMPVERISWQAHF